MLRAKGLTWIPPVGQILILLILVPRQERIILSWPRFDREFVMIFQRHGLSAAKMAPDLNSTLFKTKA